MEHSRRRVGKEKRPVAQPEYGKELSCQTAGHLLMDDKCD
jgi:hypothetical protein